MRFNDPGSNVSSLHNQVMISPVARALMKAREGDVVELRTPAGIEPIEVIEIRYQSDASG